MRNTAEYEAKLRNAKRNKRMEILKRRGTAIYGKLVKPFARASKINAKPHAKILNIELPVEPEDVSTLRIRSPMNNISTINLEQKLEKSPASLSHSSSSGEENCQSQNQEAQSESHQSELQGQQEQPVDERHTVLGSPTMEKFLTQFEHGNVRRRKKIKSAKD